jgi:epoxyqueuosine reductase
MSRAADPMAGYITHRFAGRGTDTATLSAFLADLVAINPRNVLPEGDNPPIWEAPVVGVAAASDPLFKTLKQPGVVGSIHVDPDNWLQGARSVVSFFLPFSRQVKKSYSRRSHFAFA